VRESGSTARRRPSTAHYVAFGVPGELACARKRAEEVGGAFVHQPPGGAVGIHCHPANGIYGELALGRLPFADGGKELDGLANIAQHFAAARLIEHALELGHERGGLRRQQDLAASRHA
jgi:hypothetical protein